MSQDIVQTSILVIGSFAASNVDFVHAQNNKTGQKNCSCPKPTKRYLNDILWTHPWLRGLLTLNLLLTGDHYSVSLAHTYKNFKDGKNILHI